MHASDSGRKIFLSKDGQTFEGAAAGRGGKVPKLSKAAMQELIVNSPYAALAQDSQIEFVRQLIIPAINKVEHVDILKMSREGREGQKKVALLIAKWLAGLNVNAVDMAAQIAAGDPVLSKQQAQYRSGVGLNAALADPNNQSALFAMQKVIESFNTLGAVLTTSPGLLMAAECGLTRS